MSLGRAVEVEEERRHPFLRVLLILLVLLVLAVGAAVFGGAFWVRHTMRASLPQLDGRLAAPGLSAPVTVRRDQHGIPHIEAASIDDLLFAQGYVTAQDRLWELDMARRMAAGDAAEILGPKLLEHDRTQRVLAVRATAERLTASLDERRRRYFSDYAQGVNAFIAGHQDQLPVEFRMLFYQPKPWQPVDSMLVAMSMVQLLDQHWPDKVERERITAKLGPALAADLYPTGSWRDRPPITTELPITAPQPPIPDVPLDESQISRMGDIPVGPHFAQDDGRIRGIAWSNGGNGFGVRPGSNEWVVAGSRTASGKPMLSNDMHLEHQIPDIWYEIGLKAPGLHVAGLSIPGIPFVVAGHNEHVAWGFTALYGDTQDVYVERVNAQDQYEGPDGAWHAIEHDRETIHVRGGKDETIDVRRTGHGVVVTPLIPGERRTLALKWTVYDPKAAGFPLFDMDTAGNWNDFRNALSQWWGPTQNVVYADDQGHIGYQAVGYIPNRPSGLAGTPIEDEQHEWRGFLAFDQLPSAFDPPDGILATANARVTPDHPSTPAATALAPAPASPRAPAQAPPPTSAAVPPANPAQNAAAPPSSADLTLEWGDPYRNERIWKWLGPKDKLTQADMLTLQTDVYSELDQEMAQRLAYGIDHASHVDARLRQAADLLRTWNGVTGIDSAPAAIVASVKTVFWPMVLSPKLGDDWKFYHWAESLFAAEQILMHEPAGWLPHQYATWDDFLADMVRQGLAQSHAPGNLRQWQYGYAHPVDVEHPLFGLLPWFKSWTGTGELPQSGDTSTVKQVTRTFGPSQRFTIDWGNVDGATENIVMGESGNPLSPYYRDQWAYWYGGKTFALPFSDAAVAAATAHTLRLEP